MRISDWSSDVCSSDLTVSCEVRDHIALVTMNNPPVNAQNRQFHEDMMAVFDEISDRPEIRVAILTGAGKCFSAGADIKGRAGRQMAAGESWGPNRRARECFHSIMECKKPVISSEERRVGTEWGRAGESRGSPDT